MPKSIILLSKYSIWKKISNDNSFHKFTIYEIDEIKYNNDIINFYKLLMGNKLLEEIIQRMNLYATKILFVRVWKKFQLPNEKFTVDHRRSTFNVSILNIFNNDKPRFR